MIKPQTLKGFRDFLPADARKRKYVKETLQAVFESFGFEPIETPTLEYEEVLAGKYGEEGEKLMYRFEDHGKRRVAMRYDQTVPLARIVAQYQNEIVYPFKRYNIQNVWRADKPQKGRFREFLQCDADIVGVAEPTTDAEILAVVSASLKALGFRGIKILVNDRKVFGELPIEAIITIDKLKKIGEDGVKKELVARGFGEDTLAAVQNAPLPESLNSIIDIATRMGVDRDTIIFEPTLARGLDYYTGLIFEIEIDGYTVGSVCGGGRYDNLIGMFAGKQIPAVGFAFGFDRVLEAMTEQELFPASTDATAQILVTIFAPEYAEASLEIATKLRSNNIKTELWLDAKSKMEKQLKYADNKAISYILIIGPSESEKHTVILKDMKKRAQKEMRLEEVIEKLKKEE